MNNSITRRRFAAVTCGSLGLLSFPPLNDLTKAQSPHSSTPKLDKGPALAPDLTREIVGAAHRDLEGVKSLVTADPELVNACWDWGGGDYETALGAAAHTGQREIARFLLDRGARLDLFAAAMLGLLDVLKAALAAEPFAQYALGPHGITLLNHAIAGGEQAQMVRAFLERLKDEDALEQEISLSPRAMNRYVGHFAAEGDATSPHEITAANGRLRWMQNGQEAIELIHRGNHRFTPSDSRGAIHLEFSLRKSFAQAIAIRQGDVERTAQRSG